MFVYRDKPASLVASQRGRGYDSFTNNATASSTVSEEHTPLFERYQKDDDDNNNITTTELKTMMMIRRDSDVLLPARNGNQRCSKVGLMFGIAVVVGVLVWLGTFTYALSVERDLDVADDDNLLHPYQRRRSLAEIVPLPFMRHYDAQWEADHAKDYLYYVEPDRHSSGKHKHHNKRASAQLWQLGDSDNTTGQDDAGVDDEVEAAEGCEGTVILMRHCEKYHIREHCNYVGYERSVYIASLFGDDVSSRWPAPSYIFAEEPGARRNPNKQNFRELETVLPLSDKFQLDVDTSYSSLDTSSLARKVHGLFRSGDMCGKVMVIAWKHSKLPRLANALGCARNEGCPNRYHGTSFDELWQLKFVYSKPLHSEHKSLKQPKDSRWLIFGSTQPEAFDPLAFSKIVGDYPQGGTKTGGRWRSLDHEIPDRDVIPRHKRDSFKL